MRAEMALRMPAPTLRTCGVMPAEGAMRTETEAPATEPLSFRKVTKRFGALTALAGIDLSLRTGELTAVVDHLIRETREGVC